MSEFHLTYPTAAEQLACSHGIEWTPGWQYAKTYRLVRGLKTEEQRTAAWQEPPAELMVPPVGDGWEQNLDCNDGWLVVVPAWCKDGTAALQRVYWRRPGWSRPPWNR